MNKKINFLLFLTLSILTFQSCNPECDSASRANILIEPELVLPESEFLLRSNPPSFIQERKVFIDDPDGGIEKLELETRMANELGGLIAVLPDRARTNPPIYVEDPDCTGDFIFVNRLQVEEEDFFFSSDLFVVPPLPIIIIPNPPPATPAIVTNAWITPYRRSYCIWFVPLKDETGKELKELRPLKEDDDINFPNEMPIKGSHEFVVCPGTDQRHVFANVNPVSGIIDKENNFISINIDRSAKGLGIENFSGMFIEIGDQTPNTPEWRNGGGCAPNDDVKGDYMLLTSSATGQQLLMIKAGPG